MEIQSSQKVNTKDIDNEKQLGDMDDIKSSQTSSDITQNASYISQEQLANKQIIDVEVDLKLYIGHDIYRKKARIKNYDQLQQITQYLIKNHYSKIDDSDKDHVIIFDQESFQTAIDDINNLNYNSHHQHILKLYAELVSVSDTKLTNVTLSFSSLHKQSSICSQCMNQRRNNSQNLLHHDHNSFDISQNQSHSQNILNSLSQFQNYNMTASNVSQNESGIYNGEDDTKKHKDHQRSQKGFQSSELENQNKLNNMNHAQNIHQLNNIELVNNFNQINNINQVKFLNQTNNQLNGINQIKYLQQINNKFQTHSYDLHNNSFHTPTRKNEQNINQFNKNQYPSLHPHLIVNQFDSNQQQYLLLKEYLHNNPNNDYFNQPLPNNNSQGIRKYNPLNNPQNNQSIIYQNLDKQPSFNEIEKFQLNQNYNQLKYRNSFNHQNHKINNRADTTECLSTKSYNQDENNNQNTRYRQHNSLDDVSNMQKLTSQINNQNATKNNFYHEKMYNYHNNIIINNQNNNITHNNDNSQNNSINNFINNNIIQNNNDSINQDNTLIKDMNQELFSNYALTNENVSSINLNNSNKNINDNQIKSSPKKHEGDYFQNQNELKNSSNKDQQQQQQQTIMSNDNATNKSNMSETFKIESLLNYSLQFNNQKDLFCSDDLIDQSIVVQKPQEEIKIQNYPQYLQTLKQIQKKTVEDLKKDHNNPQCVMELLSSEKCKFCQKNIICKYKDKQKLIFTIINYKVKQILPYLRPLIQKQIESSKKVQILTHKKSYDEHMNLSKNSYINKQNQIQTEENNVQCSKIKDISIQNNNIQQKVEEQQFQFNSINSIQNTPTKSKLQSSQEQSIKQNSDKKESDNKHFKDISFQNFNDVNIQSNSIRTSNETNAKSQKQHINFDQNKNLLMPINNKEQSDNQNFHSFNDFPDESNSLFQSFDNFNLNNQIQNKQQQFYSDAKEDDKILENYALDLKPQYSVYSNDQDSHNKNEINQQINQNKLQPKSEMQPINENQQQKNTYKQYKNQKQYEQTQNNINKRIQTNQKQSRFYAENQNEKQNSNVNNNYERNYPRRHSIKKDKVQNQHILKNQNRQFKDQQDELYDAVSGEFQICSNDSSFSDEIEESKDQKSDKNRIKSGSFGVPDQEAQLKEYSKLYSVEVSQTFQNQRFECMPGERKDIIIELKNTGQKYWDSKKFYLKCIKGMYENYKFFPQQKVYYGQLKMPEDVKTYRTSWRLFETKSKIFTKETAFGCIVKIEFAVGQTQEEKNKFWSELKTQLTQLLDMNDKAVNQKVNDFIQKQQNIYNNKEINKNKQEQLISEIINSYFDS